MGKSRNKNLDVLRCFSMMAIVLCHVYQHDTAIVSTTWTRDMLFHLLTRWHVDVFVGLSGWFGINFSIKKFFRIWGIMAFYAGISIFVGRWVLGVDVPLRIDGGWFGNTYLCLMLVSPIVNASIDGLVAKGIKSAWLAWFGFTIVMLLNWVSRNCYFGILAWDVFSHSLVQMVYVYFTVRLLRLTGMIERIRLHHIGICALFFVFGCFVLGKARTDYIAPYVVGMSIALLVFFDRYIRIPEFVTRLCVWMARAMFGVYLLHGPSSFGKLFHRVPLRSLVEHGVNPTMSIVLASVTCFVLCFAIELIRRSIFDCMKTICFRYRKG